MYKNFASSESPIVITTCHFDADKPWAEKIAQKEREKQQNAHHQLQQMGFEI